VRRGLDDHEKKLLAKSTEECPLMRPIADTAGGDLAFHPRAYRAHTEELGLVWPGRGSNPDDPFGVSEF
jgi:hypothetical protein